jgi:hypothetical protein
VNASTSQIKTALTGLERNVGPQFDLSRCIQVAQAGLPEDIRLNIIIRIRPVGMVENIQELRLQAEAESFPDRNDLRERHVVIPNARSNQPRIGSEGPRRGVLADIGEQAAADARRAPQHLWIDGVLVRAGGVEHADGALQLCLRDAIQD